MAIELSLLNAFDFADVNILNPDRGLQGDGITFNPVTETLFISRTDDPDDDSSTPAEVSILQFGAEGDDFGEFISSFTLPASGPRGAVGLTTLPNGNLLIASPSDGRLYEVAIDGTEVDGGIDITLPAEFTNGDVSTGGRSFIVGTAYSEVTDTILVATSRSLEIIEFDLNGNEISSLDTSQFGTQLIGGLEIEPTTGNFLIAEDFRGTNKIYEITPQREELVISGNSGLSELVSIIDLQAEFGLDDPEGLSIDDDNNILFIVFDGDDEGANGNQVGAFSLTRDLLSSFDTDIPRFQSLTNPGSYLFTGGSEAQTIRDSFADSFTEEGLAFTASSQPGDALEALYRFRSSQGTYLLVGEEERAAINADPNFSGEYIEEGLAFYVFGAGSGEGTEFNRLRNVNVPGTYLYATGDELANIQTNLSDIYVDEGIAFEALI